MSQSKVKITRDENYTEGWAGCVTGGQWTLYYGDVNVEFYPGEHTPPRMADETQADAAEVEVVRYDNPAAVGWTGIVQLKVSEGFPPWVLYYDDETGKALFFHRSTADGGVLSIDPVHSLAGADPDSEEASALYEQIAAGDE